ncbi:hypothetical protein BD408DRAFT_408321 [Parasitella parasitica]|nr:hypothetical protein BD408DRAFT_408321 [Parasitella parasitica]
MDRYHAEQKKLCDEEVRILTSARKSRFELELAHWEVEKLDHQLELVQKQWEENGMEDLVREELSKFSNSAKSTSTASSVATKLAIM